MKKTDLMKIVLLNTKHFYNISTPQALEAVAQHQAKNYQKGQLIEMVNNINQVVLGIEIH